MVDLKEFVDKLKSSIIENGELTDEDLKTLKDKADSFDAAPSPQFIEGLLNAFTELMKGEPQFTSNQKQKTRATFLDIVSKGLLRSYRPQNSAGSSSNISTIFDISLKIMKEDNEANASIACRFLLDIIKTWHTNLKIEENFGKLFEFLEEKVAGLLGFIKSHLGNSKSDGKKPHFSESLSGNSHSAGQQTIPKNSEALKFYVEIPNLYLHSLNYIDSSSTIIKNSLKSSLLNMIKTIKEAPYQELLTTNRNKGFTNELFNVMIKMIQFVSIIFRKDINNDKLLKHSKEQAEHIKSEEINIATLSLLKNIPDDSYIHRIDIMNSLKTLVKNLGKEKFNQIGELLEEDIIFGKSKFQSVYAKNAIYNSWMEIMLLLKDTQDLNISQLNKIFDILSKNIFDTTLYLNVQYKSLKLQKELIENMQKNRKNETREHTEKLINKILHKIVLKLSQIKENFEEILLFLKPNLQDPKFSNPPSRTLYISSLPEKSSAQNPEDWDEMRLSYIEDSKIDIDYYLLISMHSQSNTMTLFEDEEELVVNCVLINQSTYLDYFREVRDTIISMLIETTTKIIQYLATQSSNPPLQPSSQNPNPSVMMAGGSAMPQQGAQKPPIKSLTEEECNLLSKLLESGLKVFEYFHNLDFHNEDKDKTQLQNFMTIFALIQDPNNFRDIIEANMETIFKFTLKYAKECFEKCLQNMLIIPFYGGNPNTSQQQPQNWRYFAEILVKFLLLKIENSPEDLDPSHPYYEYKEEYHSLLQKLIKIPIRSLYKIYDDTFIRPYFKQFILCLIKKSHTSKYPLEYLQLLKQLFKNLIYYHKYEHLNQEFYALCTRNIQASQKNLPQTPTYVNIMENFIALYNTGVQELKDIVTEMMVMLPLKSKFYINLCKTHRAIVKILINSLLISDTHLLMRGMKLFDMLFSSLSHVEVISLLDGAKDEMLNNLYVVIREYEARGQTDITLNAIKVLGKMGYHPRMMKTKLNISNPEVLENEYMLDVSFNDNYGKHSLLDCSHVLKVNLVDAVNSALKMIKLLIENRQSMIVIKSPNITKSYNFLRNMLIRIFAIQTPDIDEEGIDYIYPDLELKAKNKKSAMQIEKEVSVPPKIKETLVLLENSVIDKIIQGLVNFWFLNQPKHKKELEPLLIKISKKVVISIITNAKEDNRNFYSKKNMDNLLFIRAIISNMNYRGLLLRGDSALESINYPFHFSYKIIEQMVDLFITLSNEYEWVKTDLLTPFLHFVFDNFVHLCFDGSVYKKHSGIVCIWNLLDKFPHQFWWDFSKDLFSTIYFVLTDLTDVICLDTQDMCLKICDKALNSISDLLKQAFEDNEAKFYHLIVLFVENLVSYREICHLMSRQYLEKVKDIVKVDVIQLFYLSQNSPNQPNFDSKTVYKHNLNHDQVNISINNLIEKFPDYLISRILQRIKKALDVTPKETEYVKMTEMRLKLISTSFQTLEYFLSFEAIPFRVLTFTEENEDTISVSFDNDFLSQIEKSISLIKTSERNNKNWSSIIIQNAQTGPSAFNQPQINPAQAGQPLENFQGGPNMKMDEERKDNNGVTQPGSMQGMNPQAGSQPSGMNGYQGNPQGVPQGQPIPIPNNPQGGVQQNIQQAASSQYTINTNTFLDDEEFNLNIDDIDLEIKNWSKAISSAMVFLKSVLVWKVIRQLVKKTPTSTNQKKYIIEKLSSRRYEIIFTFFEMMTRIEKKIRKTAGKCLKSLIILENNPKDLVANDEKLKSILRPVLICLQQDFKCFSTSFLSLLKKLLKLLKQCFNKALSDKLLEHLKTHISSQPYRKPQMYPGNFVVPESKCISGLLALFEHLSYAYQQSKTDFSYALQSVDTIIKSIKKVENSGLPQLNSSTSPYSVGKSQYYYTTRRPLCRFLNKIASTAIEFFCKHETLSEHGKIFIDILKLNEAHVLRERLLRDTQQLKDKLLCWGDESNLYDKSLSYSLKIIRILSKKHPRWLLNNRIIIDRLLSIWREDWIQKYDDGLLTYSIQNQNQPILILKTFVLYCKMNKNELDLIFKMLEIFNNRIPNDFSFLKKFYKYVIPNEYSPSQKKEIFLYYLNFIGNNTIPLETKVNAGYMIIYPMLLKSLKRGEASLIFEPDLLNKFCSLISVLKDKGKLYSRLDVDILQISALIMPYMKNELSETKRKIELISFGWNMIKSEDRILKNIGYIFVCKFIVHFTLPEQNILQIFISLLKSQEYINQFDNDVKILNRKALDILIPYLPNIKSEKQHSLSSSQGGIHSKSVQKPVQAPSSESKKSSEMEIEEKKEDIGEGKETRVDHVSSQHQSNTPGTHPQHQVQSSAPSSNTEIDWIEWTYRIFNEESCMLENNFALGRFWHIFIKNHKIFYIYRKKFNTQLINSMQYIFVSANANNLYRKIASDLSFIYIEWQYQELREELEKIPTRQEKISYLNNLKMDECPEIFLNFFIKLAMRNSEKDNQEVIKRSLYLLKKMFLIWPHTKPKFETISKQCSTIHSNQPNNRDRWKPSFNFTLLTILNSLLDFEKHENIMSNIELIFKLLNFPGLNNCFVNENPYLIKLVANIIKKLLKITNTNVKIDEKGLWFLRQLYDLLKKGFTAYIEKSKNSDINIYVTTRILKLLFDFEDDNLNNHLSSIKEVTFIFVDIFRRKEIVNNCKREITDENEDILSKIEFSFTDENYELMKFQYINLREFLVIFLRILASKFNQFQSREDQIYIVESIFLSILENIIDYDLKIEVINLLKSLFLPNYVPLKHHHGLVKANFTDSEKISFFFSVSRIKLFLQFSEKFQEEKVQKSFRDSDKKILKMYNKFLSELLHTSSTQIDPDKLRSIILLLIKMNSYSINKLLFEHIDILFGNYLKTKILYIFGEFSNEKEEVHSDFLELYQFIHQYLLYVFSNGSKITSAFPHNKTTLSTQKACEVKEEYMVPEEEKGVLGGRKIVNEIIGDFIKHMKSFPISDKRLYNEYAELVSCDFNLKYSTPNKIWRYAFEHLWEISTQHERQSYIIVIENFLINNHYIPQIFASTLIEFLIDKKGEILIPCEKMQYIAKRSNCWFPAIFYCEETIGQNDPKFLDGAFHSLHEILMRLNENDYLYGLRRLMANDFRTQMGVSLVQMREWVKAYEIFHQIMNEHSKMRDSMEMEGSYGKSYSSILDDSIKESCMTEIMKNLNQWGAVKELSERTDNFILKMETAWQNKDFETIDSEFLQEDSFFYMKEGFKYIRLLADSQKDEMNQESLKNINAGLNYVIQEWMALPKTISCSHIQALLKIQSFVELEEGFNLIPKLSNNSYNPQPSNNGSDPLEVTFQEIIMHMNLWRERLPHKFEDLSTWKMIVDQRNFIYYTLQKRLAKFLHKYLTADESDNMKKLSSFQDLTWNNLKFSQIERSYGFFGNIKKIIENPDTSSYQSPEIFMKSRETIHLLRRSQEMSFKSIDDYIRNFIHEPIFSTFSTEQKNEFYLLRFQTALETQNLTDDVLSQFKETLKGTVDPSKNNEIPNFKNWFTWQKFCFIASDSGQNLKWAENMILALSFSLKYKPHKTRLFLADMFYLLSRTPKLLPLLERIVDDFPVWIWLLWIPNLFSIILRTKPENMSQLPVTVVSGIFKKLIILYPQLIYLLHFPFTMKQSPDYFLNLDALTKLFQQLFQKPNSFNQDSMKKFITLCMETERSKWDELNNQQYFLKFNQVIQLMYQLQLLSESTPLRQDLKTNYLEQGKILFPDLEPFFDSFLQKIDSLTTKNLYKTILELTAHLKSDPEYLRDSITRQYKKESIVTFQTILTDIDIPGQINGEREPNFDKQIKFARISRDYQLVKRNRIWEVRLNFTGADMKTYSYIIKREPGTKDLNFIKVYLMELYSDQLRVYVNSHAALFRESAYRSLKITTIKKMKVMLDFALVEDNKNMVKLVDIMENHLRINKHDIDLPITGFKFLDNLEIPNSLPIITHSINTSMKKFVGRDVLKNFVLEKSNNHEDYFYLRKSFTNSYSTTMFFSFLLSNNINLESLSMDISKGKLYINSAQFMSPEIDTIKMNYIISISSMRMTPNFVEFVTDYGIEGIFAGNVASIIMALKKEKAVFKSFVYLLFKELNFIKFEKDAPPETIIDLLKNFFGKVFDPLEKSKQKGEYDDMVIMESVYKIIDIFLDENIQDKMSIKYKNWF